MLGRGREFGSCDQVWLKMHMRKSRIDAKYSEGLDAFLVKMTFLTPVTPSWPLTPSLSVPEWWSRYRSLWPSLVKSDVGKYVKKTCCQKERSSSNSRKKRKRVGNKGRIKKGERGKKQVRNKTLPGYAGRVTRHVAVTDGVSCRLWDFDPWLDPRLPVDPANDPILTFDTITFVEISSWCTCMNLMVMLCNMDMLYHF